MKSLEDTLSKRLLHRNLPGNPYHIDIQVKHFILDTLWNNKNSWNYYLFTYNKVGTFLYDTN